MAVLLFSGEQVAFFGGINDVGSATEFTGINAPFLSTDSVEIEVPDQFIGSDGELDPNEVQFTRVTVIRASARYDFEVDSGSKIKETGGSEIPEAGDTFFTTNDSVGPPANGPFAGLPTEKLVFSTNSSFATGQTTTISRTTDSDLNNDGDFDDPGESGNAGFNANLAPICYASGTLIETNDGPKPVELISSGDLILTRDRGPQPVIWNRCRLQALEGLEHDAKPVLISAGSLGHNTPRTDLIVSPNHRILVGGAGQLEKAFTREAFAPAKSLTKLRGVRAMLGRKEIVWVHFVCAQHEVVLANGCWSESLLLGPMAQRSLTLADRDLLTSLLPLPEDPAYLNGLPALPCVSVGEARRVLRRARTTKRQLLPIR